MRLGDRVIVEHPTFPPLLDLLEQIGVEVIGVPTDDEGIEIDGLTDALRLSPTALFLQPRAQNPTGVNMSASRARAVARAIEESDVAESITIIEDDHAGDIASGDLHSIGRHLPRRTVHIRSYSKSHGPDLRLAAVGGAGDVISRAANRRLLGPGWSSRILQAVLLELLDDERTLNTLRESRDEYARRRRTVVEILSECVEFFEGAFDAAVPRKGGNWVLIDEKKGDGSPEDADRHDVTDEVAAFKLAGLGWPGKFGVFYENKSRATKNTLEADLIRKAKERTKGASDLALLQGTFAKMR